MAQLPATLSGACLLIVDVQARLAPAIPEAQRIIPLISRLIEATRTAGLPILATEQYSQGLGPTVPALSEYLAEETVVEKIHFAAPREATFRDALEDRGVRHCLVVGTEAHVCVLQSVLALLAGGWAVTVVADAVASRRDLNRRVALARLARAGAEIVESAALLEDLAAASGEALSP